MQPQMKWDDSPRPNRFLKYTYSACILVLVADALSFDWDEANVGHVARHNVTPEEVEQVFANDPMDLGAEVVDGEERYTGVGHTKRLRVLVLVWTMRGDATRPITAFDASERLATRYLAERGL
jgi:uncharacterized DUF497 family protein